MEALITNPELQEQIRQIRQCPEMLERTGDYWTEEEQEQLCKLYRAGVGISEIAIKLKRAESAIIMQLTDLGEIRRSKRTRASRKGQCLCENCRRGPEHPDCPRCEKRRCANAGEL